MAFNTKVDVADTELEENEAAVAEAEDVTLEDEALVEAESADDADEDDEETDESEDSLTYSNGVIEKIVAMATPQNVALLAVGRALYNPETGTAAHILSQQIDDKGARPTITLRGAVGAARLAQRVVMGTVAVKDAETGMRAMVSQNLRGLPIQLAAPAGTGVTLDTQVSWGSVLEGLETLASTSGLGFGCAFGPAAGTEAFAAPRARATTATWAMTSPTLPTSSWCAA